jgi:enolase
MARINFLEAREILDSRGNPTVEVSLRNEKGEVKASVPSGASKGKYEALELRDGGKRYRGLGVLDAVNNVNQKIAPLLKKENVLDQKKVDQILIDLDGTSDKSKLGANALLGVSIAVCKAGALASGKTEYQYINQLYGKCEVSLPRPAFNIINGGVHAGNELNFQEFMVLSRKKKIKEAIREITEIYYSLKENLSKKYSSQATNVGDEGGFAPPISDPEDAIKIILDAGKVDLIIDVAAGEFFEDEGYKSGINHLQKEELVNQYLHLIRKYPILGLEDPFSEDDWAGWKLLKSKTQGKTMIIGDDLLATNPERIEEAENHQACDAMILKLNQIGTVTEAMESARKAREFKWKTIVSHRSGETNDSFISDFAVGIGADFIKAGAPIRGERVAKYNRLMEIEKEILK